MKDLKEFYDYLDASNTAGLFKSINHAIAVSAWVYLSRWQLFKLGLTLIKRSITG